VHALEIGADDYLVKPFSMKELVARVRAAARRGIRVQDERRGEPIDIEELRVDPLNVQAYVGGESAELTPTEFRLLYALALEQGAWSRRASSRRSGAAAHAPRPDRGRLVRKIRDKLESQGPAHTFVHTRYGVGYKLEAVAK
jgi:DNA-binding response OmpR family regulator